MNIDQVLDMWNKDSKKVAKNIIDKYGDPDEFTESLLVWYNNGPWKKTIISKEPTKHIFPMPHTDIVEQFIPYDVPVEKFEELAEYDGSVTVKRTEGLMSARCHDEPANFLALNLAHDIITDKITVEEARDKYVQNLVDFRKNNPTLYMEDLQFDFPEEAGDKGEQMISKEKLEKAKEESKE